MGGEYPWGKETDLEKLTYEIEDTHPEVNVIRGEAETTLDLRDRVLVWSGHLSFTSDPKNFSTNTPRVAEGRESSQNEDLGGEDS